MDSISGRGSGRVYVDGSVMHCSEALFEDRDCGEIVHAGLLGGKRIVWHSAPEFSRSFQRFAVTDRMRENALQRYAVALFEEAYSRKAQDIHIIQTGDVTRIRLRILGDLVERDLRDGAFGQALMGLLYNYFAQQTGGAVFSPMQRLDGRIVNPKVLPAGILSVRLHTEPIQSETRECGTFMTLRLLYDATEATGTLDERLLKLGFLDRQREALAGLTRREGLCVISGATGHGKSTLLKHVFEAMVRDDPGRSYLSVEDPPEYILEGVEQIQVVTQGAVHGEARRERYQEALAGALRSDPDVLMIGEIRYAEACATAVSAALTGHAVWATLHANDVFGIIRRMEALLTETGIADPRPRLLEPGVLSGLVHQRLVPVLCPDCKQPFSTVRKKDAALYERVTSVVPTRSVCTRGPGCARCGGRGCVSMTLCAEVLTLSPGIHDALLDGSVGEARTIWKKDGGMTCLEVARKKCALGMLDPADIERRLSCPLTG